MAVIYDRQDSKRYLERFRPRVPLEQPKADPAFQRECPCRNLRDYEILASPAGYDSQVVAGSINGSQKFRELVQYACTRRIQKLNTSGTSTR